MRAIFEWILGVILLVLWGIPVALGWSGAALLRRRRIVERCLMSDGGRVFLLASSRGWIREIPLLARVVTGRAGLCGRGFRYAGETPPGEALTSYPPAFFSPWTLYLRCRLGIRERDDVELEFCRDQSIRSDLSLLLKTAFAVTFFPLRQSEVFAPELNLFGISFANLTLEDAVAQVEAAIDLPAPDGTTVFFVNPHCFNLTRQDPDYYDVICRADRRYPDGSGIVMACRMMGTPLRQNVNGTDLFPLLCAMAARRKFSLFLLGGRPGRVEIVAERMKKAIPNLRIAGVRNGYFDPSTESSSVIAEINAAQPDLLLIGMGMPLQERWMTTYRRELHVPVRVAVGGLFDFFSGSIYRAPTWLREIGMEWLFRLLMEPRRMWKRYLVGNPRFLWAVWRWRRQCRRTSAN